MCHPSALPGLRYCYQRNNKIMITATKRRFAAERRLWCQNSLMEYRACVKQHIARYIYMCMVRHASMFICNIHNTYTYIQIRQCAFMMFVSIVATRRSR